MKPTVNDKPAATGADAREGCVSAAVLPVASGTGTVSDVGFAWLLLTDYELAQLAAGIMEDTVQTQARRLSEELTARLAVNAAKPVRKGK